MFTPSILTILGVVMYLRLGWVLGHLGLPMTLLTVTLASSITLLTGLSLAALATNMRVGGGGAYFIISRSLGVEAGAAIGLPLYLAQTLGISFYIVGFSESFVGVFPQFDPHMVGVLTLAVLGVLVTISADLALRGQFFIMAAIGVSLLSFFLGRDVPQPRPIPGGGQALMSLFDWVFGGSNSDAPLREIRDTLPFWTVFAVFFPAVTGIEAGIAMSGDLKKPARSLPVGTLAAVLTGWAVYVGIAIFLAAKVHDRSLLLGDPLIMEKIARWGDLVILGIWAASLSSALGALLGAPRTMQALARDCVLPRVLGKGFGKGNDPRIATGVAFAISLAGVLLGDLNLIAPILSMFFLTSYGMLNFSAGMEELINPASWRPTFRVPAVVSLTGAFACLCVMIMIAPAATVAAVLICVGIYVAMKRRSMRAQWGDMRVGILMFIAREVLHRINRFEARERNWQPNLLVLSGAPATRWHLVQLANAISRDRCFVTIAAVVPRKQWTTERAEKLRATMREFLLSRKVRAFVRVFPAPGISEGARQLVRAYGFGPIVPNTILVGVTTRPDSFTEFTRLALLVHRTRRNLIVLRRETGEAGEEDPDAVCDPAIPVPDFAEESKEKFIDVWWRGGSPHALLMLTVAHLLTRSRTWRKTKLRIRTVVSDPSAAGKARAMLEELISKSRLSAQTDAVVRAPDQSPFEAIRDATTECSLVFLGLQVPGDDANPDEFRRYYRDLMEQTRGLPTTAFVMASENIDFTRIVGPES